jgi:photosystem II stability/assembly factor-like uncharacterized protein
VAHAAHRRLYVGVEPAGLFVSGDGGESFREVEGLRRHPSRPQWQPGGIGLVLHSIVSDPTDVRRLWVGISSVGVFYTEDGGETWSPRNSGTRCDFLPEGERYPEFGQCVHNLTLAPGCSDRLYQQNHCGMYRSDDGGASWRSIENGLPSSFGFPVAAHPRDADTLFFLPLNGDTKGRYPPDARAAVWRSRDGGAHWADGRVGLPQSGAYFGVMRQALATDALNPAGVYFGTSNGSVYASRDEGETWECIARDLPAISSVETMTAA